MSSQKIKFGDKEVDKKEFYSSKQAILLDSADLSKIVVSSGWKVSETKYKYFCGYLNNDVIQHLYIKYFDDGGKICHLLRMINKFMKNIMKHGIQLKNF